MNKRAGKRMRRIEMTRVERRRVERKRARKITATRSMVVGCHEK